MKVTMMVMGHRHQLIEDWTISSSLADAENRFKIAKIFLPNCLRRLPSMIRRRIASSALTPQEEQEKLLC